MSGPQWYTRSDGTEKLRFGLRICAFTSLSTAGSRWIDARYAAAGAPPGSPAKVHAADLQTALDDRRAAHTIALGYRPDQLQPNGLRRPGERR
jgi:hypothetical protein